MLLLPITVMGLQKTAAKDLKIMVSSVNELALTVFAIGYVPQK